MQTPAAPQTGYAPVNGLQMYYEIHGSGGLPLVLLHGAFSNIETDFSRVLPGLAQTRQVIGVEQHAHGRTADIDRPLSYEQMADDTAALLRHLGIAQADLFGYSVGSSVAMQLAIRHPGLVRKLVFSGGTGFNPAGYYPEVFAGGASMAPEALAEMMAGTPWGQAYARMAPNPDDWVTYTAKKMDLDRRWLEAGGWAPAALQSIQAPVLLIIGDSDIVRPEHTIELFRLLGGGVAGDIAGLPHSQLAVLPGTTHVTLVERADWLVPMIADFLDAPMPETA